MKKFFTYLFFCCLSILNANEKTIDNEKSLVIVSASRNNAKYFKQNLDSTLMQNYTNYRIIWVDDASTDGTGTLVEDYLKKNDTKNRVTLIQNKKRLGAMENFYRVIHSCKDSDIIVIVDGDDRLVDNMVLQEVNKAYSDSNVWLTYGDDKPEIPWNLHWSFELPEHIIKSNGVRNYKWVTGHLRTFYAWLFKLIKVDDLKYKGEFAKFCPDLASMFPMVEMAGFHSKFINKVLYIYNNNSEYNEFRDETYNIEGVAYMDYLRSLKKYEPLNNPPITL